MNKLSNILVVGHNDITEKSLYSFLKEKGYSGAFSSSLLELDVLSQAAVRKFFNRKKIQYVFLGSTRSGGIEANRKRGAEFLYHNLVSAVNVLEASRLSGVRKLLYFGSSCVYPKDAAQPIKPRSLLTGELEKTSEPYAVAKIAGIKLCQAFRRDYGVNAIVGIPATVYGPGMETGPDSHVMGALLKTFCDAVRNKRTKVAVWGSGGPRREFLYSDDFAHASLFLMENYDGEEIVNIGSGKDVSVKELAGMIARAAGFKGQIKFDKSKPDGQMRKLLDSSLIRKLGWHPQVELAQGIALNFKSVSSSIRMENL